MREALLERTIMTNNAPHLVHPLPLLVPAFEGKRPERLTGVGLNMYDVMAAERVGRRRRKKDADGDGVPDWYPDRHRIIDRDEVLRLAPALAERDPSAAYLFYDCQTDDVRLVLTVLGEAERYGAVLANRCDALGLLDEDGRADGVRVRDTRRAAARSSCAPTTSSTRPASGPTGSAPRSCTRRPRSRASARAAAPTSRSPATTCRSTSA